jgi:membrane protein implicated in regulation of membrane protease activity
MGTGTIKHPYSALNLRLALALFGLVSLGALAAVCLLLGYRVAGIAAAIGAAAAAVNVAVVLVRRVQRRRREPPGTEHSLFE